MAIKAQRVAPREEQVVRLLHKQIAGDERAVQRVIDVLRSLRGEPSAAWEPTPPERYRSGRVPHF